MKRNFKPDMVFIDYLNICASSRMKGMGGAINSYNYVKSIAEEIRGFAVENQFPVVTATQSNRDAFGNSDVDLNNTSECIFTDENIILRDGSLKRIGDVKIGDQIISNDGYKTVQLVHHKKMKECYKITLKSGKTIVVSKDHVFPTKRGRISLNDGLTVGDKLSSID